MSSKLAPYIWRLVIVLTISLLAVFIISEVGIRLQNESSARAPQTVELTIPAGTAQQVEAGLTPPEIPEEMAFVLGDVLLVRNLDNAGHSLGPLLIPPGAEASMVLDHAENLALTCSFSTSNYLGIDVRPPTTLSTRLVALLFAVPPTTAILYVYSLLAFPIKNPEDAKSPSLSESKN